MAQDLIPDYQVAIPGLTNAIAECPVSPGHKQLLQRLRSFETLTDAKLVTTREGGWYARSKVIGPDGTVIHDDDVKWLEMQVDEDGGDAAVTAARLKKLGYLLTRREITTLYVVNDRLTENPADFIQLVVDTEEEWLDRALLSDYGWGVPRSARDLQDMRGEELVGEGRKRHQAPQYSLGKAVNIAAFIDALDAQQAHRHAAQRGRRIDVTDGQTGARHSATLDQLDPGWDKYPSKARRWVEDWRNSSAGRSGARLCDHWVAQISDYTSPIGQRDMSLIPVWTFTKPLAKIESRKGSDYEFYGTLEKLDRRIKVPFAWYFYMLHGNRVDAHAAHRVITSAEAGTIVLPEHDYRILKSWQDREYGF